jgi:hypothetical protein
VAAKLLHVDRHPEAKSGISKNYHRETWDIQTYGYQQLHNAALRKYS